MHADHKTAFFGLVFLIIKKQDRFELQEGIFRDVACGYFYAVRINDARFKGLAKGRVILLAWFDFRIK